MHAGPEVIPTLPAARLVVVMQRNGEIRAAEALVEMVGEHRLGAVADLLAGLADQHERAMPLCSFARP